VAEWFWDVNSAADLNAEIRKIFALDKKGRGDEIHGIAHVTYSDESVKQAGLISALEGRGVAFDWKKKRTT
jgi:hypothetical protein